jgi:hypothetical protein
MTNSLSPHRRRVYRRPLGGFDGGRPNLSGNARSELRQVSIVLRVVLSRPGRIHHGEVIDAESGVSRRFSGPEAMEPAIRALLATLEEADRVRHG